MSVSVCVRVCVCMYLCMYVCMHVSTHVCVCVYECVRVRAHRHEVQLERLCFPVYVKLSQRNPSFVLRY